MEDNLYPPSVIGAPASLTTPNAKYRRQVVIVFFSLMLFMLFYFLLILGCVGGIKLAVQQAITSAVPGQPHYVQRFLIGLSIALAIEVISKVCTF